MCVSVLMLKCAGILRRGFSVVALFADTAAKEDDTQVLITMQDEQQDLPSVLSPPTPPPIVTPQ